MTSPTQHQLGQPFPRLNSPFVDSDQDNPGAGRYLAIPWYRLLITLWQRSGGPSGGQAIPQTVSSKPFTFVAPGSGTVIVNPNGQFSVSRDNGVTFYLASLAGGTVGVLANDQVLVDWSTVVPVITFFPDH